MWRKMHRTVGRRGQGKHSNTSTHTKKRLSQSDNPYKQITENGAGRRLHFGCNFLSVLAVADLIEDLNQNEADCGDVLAGGRGSAGRFHHELILNMFPRLDGHLRMFL